MKVIAIFISAIFLISQVSHAEPVRKTQSDISKKEEAEDSNGGSGTAIAGVILAGSLIALAVNSGSEPEGQDHNNNGLFTGLAIASGIALYVSNRKEKQVRLTLDEEDTPMLAFRYNF